MAGPVAALQGAVFIPANSIGAGALRPGQVLQGTISGVPGSLELRLAGLRATLDSSVPLSAGQIVSVTVEAAENGIRLLVTPITAAAEPLPSFAGDFVPDVLAKVLDLLGASAGLREMAAEILPGNLPATESEITALLRLLTTQGTVAEDLQQIAAWVSQASDAGALVPELAAQLAILARQLLPSGADDVERLVREWATQSSRTLEARLIQALETGTLGALPEALGRELRAVLLRLQGDETFRQWIAQHGHLGSFDAALGRILERTLAGSMQNLRAFEAPYLFFDLPFPADAPVTRAQVHVFGEGGRGRHGFDRKNASITLDLSTARLGDLWISLTITGGVCTCVIRAAREATVAAITAATSELGEALAEAGYPDASVQVTHWNGNRLEETVHLMRRFSGLDVRA
jgi:hypothetical protein